METRQLQALIAVADTGSATRAAELMNVVQPAVTRYIRTLETELGVSLFERSRSGMRLTDVGRQVVHHARRSLAELERAREEAAAAGHAVRGIVTVGLLTSAAALLGPGLVADVSEQFPGIRLRVVTGYAGNLTQWLESGDVDIALVFDQRLSAGFRMTEMVCEDLWAVAPRTAGLRPRARVALAEVLKRPLIMPSSQHGLRTLVAAAAARQGLTPVVSVETNDSGLQQRLVAAGHGWSVLPAIIAADPIPGVTMAPIVDPPITRTIGLAMQVRPAPPAAVQSVADILVATITSAVLEDRWPGARLVSRRGVAVK